MTLTELRYIVALARESTLDTRPRNATSASRPFGGAEEGRAALRRRILFERSSADVRLTTIGEQIAAQAERVLEEAGKLREIVAAGQGSAAGAIAPRRHLYDSALPAAAADSGAARASSADATLPARELHRKPGCAVASGELDVIVVALPFASLVSYRGWSTEEPFCVVMPRGHPLAQQSLIDPGQVARRTCCCWALATAFAIRWCRPARSCRRQVVPKARWKEVRWRRCATW
jgi:LysR family hydrogen peroxide-inducible transcriptional activator